MLDFKFKLGSPTSLLGSDSDSASVMVTPKKKVVSVAVHSTPSGPSSANSELNLKVTVTSIRYDLDAKLGRWMDFGDVENVAGFLWQLLDEGLHPKEKTVLRQGVPNYLHKHCPNGWSTLNADFRQEFQMYPIFLDIFRSIKKDFQDIISGKIKGTTKNVYNVKQHHSVSKLATSPDFVVHGDSCHICSEPTGPKYCHAHSFVDFKLDHNTNRQKNGLQLTAYARQALIDQPDCRFVLSFIITNKRLRIYGYDRSGRWYSDLVNFHTHRHLLILAILILLWSDEVFRDLDIVFYSTASRRQLPGPNQ